MKEICMLQLTQRKNAAYLKFHICLSYNDDDDDDDDRHRYKILIMLHIIIIIIIIIFNCKWAVTWWQWLLCVHINVK